MVWSRVKWTKKKTSPTAIKVKSHTEGEAHFLLPHYGSWTRDGKAKQNDIVKECVDLSVRAIGSLG